MAGESSVLCVRRFMRILRRLRFGATIPEIAESEQISCRQVQRWINVADETIGVIRTASDRPGARWVYSVDRSRIVSRIGG